MIPMGYTIEQRSDSKRGETVLSLFIVRPAGQLLNEPEATLRASVEALQAEMRRFEAFEVYLLDAGSVRLLTNKYPPHLDERINLGFMRMVAHGRPSKARDASMRAHLEYTIAGMTELGVPRYAKWPA